MPPPPPSSYRAPAELMEGAPIPGINMRSTMVSANNRDPNAPSWDAWKADIKSKEQKNLAMENWEKNLQNDHRFQLDVDREARMGGGGKKEKKKHKKHKKKHKHEKEKAASPMKMSDFMAGKEPTGTKRSGEDPLDEGGSRKKHKKEKKEKKEKKSKKHKRSSNSASSSSSS